MVVLSQRRAKLITSKLHPFLLTNSRYRKRLPYSKVCFKVVTMCLLGVGTVARLKSLATNQYATENGIVSFATNENTSVRIVPTDNLPL